MELKSFLQYYIVSYNHGSIYFHYMQISFTNVLIRVGKCLNELKVFLT